MRPALLGIIGCGAMGRLIARHIREQLPSYRLGGLFSRTTAHAEGLALELGDVPVLGLQPLIETCDLLVEATSAAAGYHAGLPCRRESRRTIERRRVFA